MKLSLLAVAALAAATTCQGSIVAYYTNQSAWAAAVGAFSTENFNSLTPGALGVGSTTLGLITYTTPGPRSSAARIEQVQPGNNYLSSIVGIDGNQIFGDLPAYNDITLPWAATAFGANWFSASSAGQLVLSIPGATINLPTYLPSPGNGFFGFISDRPFTTLRITPLSQSVSNPGEVFEMDNVRFNTAVPEPGAYLVLSLGLVAIVGRQYTRRRGTPSTVISTPEE